MELTKVLSKKEIQQVYLGASIAAGCRPCTKYHLKNSSEAGLTDIEINKTIALTISIRDNATRYMESLAYNRKAVKNEVAKKQDSLNRDEILVGIAVNYAVNFPSSLEDYISTGKNSGLDESELSEIIKISKSVIEMARAHTDMVTDKRGNVQQKDNTNKKDCCSSCDC